jgi:UDP-glucose 4-epimerase
MVYNHAVNMPITLIRFFNAIGPRHTSAHSLVVPRFIKQACNNEPITIYGNGTQIRCYCDVRDMVEALDLIAKNNESIGEIVNVGNDKEISVNDLAKLIRREAKSSSEIIYVPSEEDYMERSVNAIRRKPDLTKFFQLTHYKHRWTLDQTIKDIIQSQKTNSLFSLSA